LRSLWRSAPQGDAQPRADEPGLHIEDGPRRGRAPAQRLVHSVQRPILVLQHPLTGCVSDDLRRRALQLTDLFDATVQIRAVEPDETGEADNRKRDRQ
jgi:hypothetical protein